MLAQQTRSSSSSFEGRTGRNSLPFVFLLFGLLSILPFVCTISIRRVENTFVFFEGEEREEVKGAAAPIPSLLSHFLTLGGNGCKETGGGGGGGKPRQAWALMSLPKIYMSPSAFVVVSPKKGREEGRTTDISKPPWLLSLSPSSIFQRIPSKRSGISSIPLLWPDLGVPSRRRRRRRRPGRLLVRVEGHRGARLQCPAPTSGGSRRGLQGDNLARGLAADLDGDGLRGRDDDRRSRRRRLRVCRGRSGWEAFGGRGNHRVAVGVILCVMDREKMWSNVLR